MANATTKERRWFRMAGGETRVTHAWRWAPSVHTPARQITARHWTKVVRPWRNVNKALTSRLPRTDLTRLPGWVPQGPQCDDLRLGDMPKYVSPWPICIRNISASLLFTLLSYEVFFTRCCVVVAKARTHWCKVNGCANWTSLCETVSPAHILNLLRNSLLC